MVHERRDSMKNILIATGNAGKVREFKSLLEPLGYNVLCLKDLPEVFEVEETGTTFKENALIKAKAYASKVDFPVVADDSGIEIDAFGKKPGVESARWLGHETSYDYKNQYILDHLKEGDLRTARYVCAIAYIEQGKEDIVVEETFEGEIGYEPKGENGFGYDPIFVYSPLQKTAAQMSLDEKNLYSHRAKALRSLILKLEERSYGK